MVNFVMVKARYFSSTAQEEVLGNESLPYNLTHQVVPQVAGS